MKKWIVRVVVVLAILLICGVVGIGILFVKAMHRFSEECQTAHYAMMMGEVVRLYVVDHDGGWPSDWKELRAYEPVDYDIGWPADEDQVRLFVEINFNLTLDEIMQDGDDIWVMRDKKYPESKFAHGYEFEQDLQLIKEALKNQETSLVSEDN